MMPTQLITPHSATVGRFVVQRSLPRKAVRTIGAWCFADLFGPADVTPSAGMDVGPHPHTGLQTVTWLFAGEVLHRDSLGSEQLIRPGQLNVMTAGRGVVHSEEATPTYRGSLHGLQLWIAQPDVTRHGDPRFEHISDLPRFTRDGIDATVFAGSFDDAVSPARHDIEVVGVEMHVGVGQHELALRSGFEYGLIVIDGNIDVDGVSAKPGELIALGHGRDGIRLAAGLDSHVVLLGGEPLGEKPLMWWNFIAREREEMNAFYQRWQEDPSSFGTVATELPLIPAPAPPWSIATVEPTL